MASRFARDAREQTHRRHRIHPANTPALPLMNIELQLFECRKISRLAFFSLTFFAWLGLAPTPAADTMHRPAGRGWISGKADPVSPSAAAEYFQAKEASLAQAAPARWARRVPNEALAVAAAASPA